MMNLQAKLLRKVSNSSDIEETRLNVIGKFRVAGIPSLTIGGFAVKEHGYTRFTSDVDFVVPDVKQAMDYLSTQGFEPNRGSSMTLTDKETGVEIDLYPAGKSAGPCPVSFPDASQLTDDGSIIDLPGLISLKLSSYIGNGITRLEDLADVVELIKANDLGPELQVHPELKEFYQKTWADLHKPIR